ncbi:MULTISPECIES: DUF3168 domain-containing protein [unclassified Bradyrhizobium]
MTSPTLELQGAIVARLKGFAGLTTLVGNRVYDNVPQSTAFPYVSWGPEQAISDDADCITGFNVTIQLDAWSRTVGLPEVKQIAEQIRLALHNYDLPLTGNALVSIEHSQTRTFRDPDGLTNHAAVEFSAFIEQP